MSGAETVHEIDRRLADPLIDCRGRSDGLGFVGPDVPLELLIASRRPFGHLPWQSDAVTPWADRWLESSFPFWSRSILEQWYAGVFDALDSVVFSRADDASQRLYYYVAELQRRGKLAGPKPLLFDIALIRRESSLQHTETALIGLMRALGITDRMFPDAIERANRLRRRFGEIESERSADGPLYERLARAALWTDPRWVDELRLPKAATRDQRILLAGSMPPDERLHRAIESAAAGVVAEAHALAPTRFGPELDAGRERPTLALARQLRDASIAPRAFFDRAAWVVERARAARATAVVIWLTREDEALAWIAPALERALAAAGLPTLLLTARRWQADDDAPDRIAEFLRRCSRATA